MEPVPEPGPESSDPRNRNRNRNPNHWTMRTGTGTGSKIHSGSQPWGGGISSTDAFHRNALIVSDVNISQEYVSCIFYNLLGAIHELRAFLHNFVSSG